jgi:hypothetical protein
MSVRNYHAFIKAARKTGGLSLPAVRKTYQKMKARLGRAPKGTDVKKHPRIFKESIPVKAGGIKRKPAGFRAASSRKRAAPGKATKPAGVARPTKPAKQVQRPREGATRPPRPARVVLRSFDDLEKFLLTARGAAAGEPTGTDEYVSTVEYKKK